MNFQADYEFANDGSWTQAQVLRYVASINLECTRKEFVDAAMALGIHRGTAANRFRESRRESVELGFINEAGEIID